VLGTSGEKTGRFFFQGVVLSDSQGFKTMPLTHPRIRGGGIKQGEVVGLMEQGCPNSGKEDLAFVSQKLGGDDRLLYSLGKGGTTKVE